MARLPAPRLQACCQRYHQSVTLKAPTAEATLRARWALRETACTPQTVAWHASACMQACEASVHTPRRKTPLSGRSAFLHSRFSAYARKEWKYIVRTTHPDNANTKGSSAEGGKVRTTFEEDIKVAGCGGWGGGEKGGVCAVSGVGCG